MVTLKPNIKTFIVRAYIFENDIDHYFFFSISRHVEIPYLLSSIRCFNILNSNYITCDFSFTGRKTANLKL